MAVPLSSAVASTSGLNVDPGCRPEPPQGTRALRSIPELERAAGARAKLVISAFEHARLVIEGAEVDLCLRDPGFGDIIRVRREASWAGNWQKVFALRIHASK